MRKIFKAQTNEGYTIKVLSDLLQHNIKTACLIINNDGIKLTMYDSHRRVCFEFMLYSENFQIYKFKSDTPLYLGINLCHFYKMIKSIKKKDSIILFINENQRDDLGIKVIPKENNRVTTSFIKIQNIQNLEVVVPNDYSNCIIVPSNEYQKLCKDMSTISNTVKITAWKYYMKFSGDAGSVYSREVSFGELDADSDSEDEEEDIRYVDVFNTDQLCRIVKISGLSSNIQVFVKEGLPMLFKTNIGNLGKLSIFIKSKSQLETDYPTLN